MGVLLLRKTQWSRKDFLNLRVATMNVKIECPTCNQLYSVDESIIGEEVECAACNHVFVAQKTPIKLELPTNKQADKDKYLNAKKTDNSEKQINNCNKSQRYSWGRYIIAFVVCAIIFILYNLIGVFLFNWKHGGGAFPMALLLIVLSGVWRSIVPSKKKDKESVSEKEPNNNIIVSSNPSFHNSSKHYFDSENSVNQNNSIPSDNVLASKEQKKLMIDKYSLEYDTPSKRISALIEQHDWNAAIEYCEKLLESNPSAGRQAQLWQIKVKASDFYLQKCMKRYRVFEASQLSKYQKLLIDDPDFKMALSCAVPEQVAYINKIVFNNEKGWNK